MLPIPVEGGGEEDVGGGFGFTLTVAAGRLTTIIGASSTRCFFAAEAPPSSLPSLPSLSMRFTKIERCSLKIARAVAASR